MSVAEMPPEMTTTEHALLIPLGHFSRSIGLPEAFARVPITMKTVKHSPADKVAQLFVHILAGGMHVIELERSPHPLVRDHAVAHAWGQAAFASASGVNGVLRAVSEESVRALTTEVRDRLAPYRAQVLRRLPHGRIVVDFDLMGVVVSDQADTYEDADFGYMGEIGRVGKGYQFARAQVQTDADSFVLGGFLHPGRTVSSHCVAELVALTEAELGRPTRRVELVEARLAEAEAALTRIEERLAARLTTHPNRPPSARLTRQRERLATEVEHLRARVEHLRADNASNPHPRAIILRLDGGFGDAATITWLYEQGYSVVARAHSSRVAAKLRTEEGLQWEKVSKNGYIAASQNTCMGDCPYPLRLFACRTWRGDEQPERWSALVVTPDLEPKTWPARRVGVFYNGRQSMEAGIKESKGIFASRHLPTRHRPGIALYEQLVLLAQNVVRWFRRRVLADTPLAGSGIKHLVRIAANTRAIVVRQGQAPAGSWLVVFSAASPWPNLTLPLSRDIPYQLCLPFSDDPVLTPVGP